MVPGLRPHLMVLKMRLSFSLHKLLIAALAFAAVSVSAAPVQIYGVPFRTLIDNDLYGGCMVALLVDGDPISVQAPGCGDDYVAFDCQATAPNTDKTAANINYQAAQLAYVLQQKIMVEIETDVVLNGFCWGRRVDNFIE